MSSKFTDGWQNLSAKTRKNIWFGALGAIVLTIIWIFVVSGEPSSKSTNPREDVSRDFFTTADTRSMGIHGLGGKVKSLEMENARVAAQMEKLREQLVKMEESVRTNRKEEQEKIKAQSVQEALRAFQQKYGDLKNFEGKRSVFASPDTPQSSDEDGTQSDPEPPKRQIDWEKSDSPQPLNQPQGQGQAPMAKGPDGKSVQLGKQIRFMTGPEPRQEPEEEDQGTWIPSGSILTGVLVTGMDAPTSQAVMSEPFPALIRVKMDAILPNYHRADVRECFVIASGYGDLSSERAYLRSERISCVRSDQKVIEIPFDMYVAGEDGKAGLRGRLVSKQGALLARAMMAGFADGFSSIFKSAPVPTLSTTTSDTTPYQKVFSNESMQTAGLEGFGSALEKLADYYMDLADKIHPVIEVDAGRKIDLVVVRGGYLNFK